MSFRPLHFLTIFSFVLVTSLGVIPEADAIGGREGVAVGEKLPGQESGGRSRGGATLNKRIRVAGGAGFVGDFIDAAHDMREQVSSKLDKEGGGPSSVDPQYLLPTEVHVASDEEQTAIPRGTATVRCNIEGTPLSPQLEQLVAQFCPPENAGRAGYCACVKGYIETNKMGASARAREEDMHRIGYQYYLEDWSKRYGASILAFGSSRPDLQGPAVLNSMPSSCKPSVMMSGLLNKIGDVSTCGGDTDAFKKALNKYFRLDGRTNSDISTLASATDENWSMFISRSTDFNRFYVRPGGRRDGEREFIDCMSPSEKRAYALLPVAWKQGSQSNQSSNAADAAQSRSTDLVNLLNAVKSSQTDPNPVRALFASPEKEKIRAVLEIFPGMENLLKHGSLSPADAGEVLTSLEKFLTEIQDPAFKNLKEAKVSKDLMDRMTAAINSVKGVVSTKIRSTKTASQLNARLNEECSDLSEDLGKIACQPEDFTHSTDFMRVAFLDAASKGTLRYSGDSHPPSFLLCSNRNRLATATTEELAGCMGYHAAQCDSKINHQDRESVSRDSSQQQQLSSMINLDLSDRGSVQGLINERNAAQSLLAAEEGVVHTMCAGFNRYLQKTACTSVELAKPENKAKYSDFRSCAVSPEQFDAYLAAGGDETVNNLNAPGADTIRAVIAGNNSSNTNVKNVSKNEDTFLAEAETLPGTVSVDNTSSVSRTSATGITTTTPGLSAVAVPIDIDTPAEIRAAIEQREQRNEVKNTEIAEVDKELSELGTDSESARLRTELESLRAEMVAERERNTREIAELRNRPNAPEAVASGESIRADEDEEVATNRRADARSSGISSGGAVTALASGFNVGGASRAPASETSSSGDFNKASVSTNFATAGAARGGLIQASSSLPAVQSQDPNARLSLRVGDASYPVSDVKSFVLPAGAQLVEADIMTLIRAQSGQIPLDAQNRAFVEIRDPSNNNSMVVYVRINGSEIEFLDANEPPAEGPTVRATLLQLESLLGAVRD